MIGCQQCWPTSGSSAAWTAVLLFDDFGGLADGHVFEVIFGWGHPQVKPEECGVPRQR